MITTERQRIAASSSLRLQIVADLDDGELHRSPSDEWATPPPPPTTLVAVQRSTTELGTQHVPDVLGDSPIPREIETVCQIVARLDKKERCCVQTLLCALFW